MQRSLYDEEGAYVTLDIVEEGEYLGEYALGTGSYPYMHFELPQSQVHVTACQQWRNFAGSPLPQIK